MARLFDDVATEYLAVGSAVLTGVPITMACWFNSDDIAANQTLLGIWDTASKYDFFRLFLGGASAGDYIEAVTRRDTVGVATTTAGFSANTWHHACGVFSATDARAMYIDGGSKGTDATDLTPVGLDTTGIGANVDNAPDNYMSGRIAEAAIWNVALTDTEVAILAAGYSPLFVHPQNLVAYWPLIRDEDQDRVGGYNLTAYNTPGIAAHPPVLYPAPPHIAHVSAAAPSYALPMAMHHYRRRRI